MREDFIEILKYLNSQKIYCGFNTNGLLLSEKVINEIGSLEYLRSIVLSMEGSDEETNDFIRGKKVFSTIIKRLHMLNEYKSNNSNAHFNTIVNFVVLNQNYKRIDEMIDICNKYKINYFNILQFIEGGNAVGKKLALSDEQFLDVVENIARIYTDKLTDTVINPKFARPLAKDYCEKCLSLSFPKSEHGCGAGTTFTFIDNKGIIYPCNRIRDMSPYSKEFSLAENDFKSIWKTKEFNQPFSVYMGSDIYKNVAPCNRCKYLYTSCFPCYLDVDINRKINLPECTHYLQKAEKMGVKLLDD